jgi:hypothetical protein
MGRKAFYLEHTHIRFGIPVHCLEHCKHTPSSQSKGSRNKVRPGRYNQVPQEIERPVANLTGCTHNGSPHVTPGKFSTTDHINGERLYRDVSPSDDRIIFPAYRRSIDRSTVPAFSHTMMGAPPKGFGIEWRHMGVSPNDLSVSPAYRRPNNRCASSAFVHTMMVQNPAFRPCASPRGLMMGASKGPGIPPAVSGIPSQFFSGPGSFMRP